MKKNFIRVMFFGALVLSTITYVGCKDYDDDIDKLQTQIDTNKAGIENLQKFVESGKWVTNVESITGGFKITFNDGKSYEIVNGDKGDKGDTGAAGATGAPGSKVTIDEKTGEWLIDNKPTGWFAKGEKGEDGKDGQSPFIGEDGYWYFWDASAEDGNGKLVKGAYAQTSVYIVKGIDRPNWILHVKAQNDDGSYTDQTVILPSADKISSMKVVEIVNDRIETPTTIEVKMYYGRVSKDFEFNGKKYIAGDLLTSKGTTINALINPVDLDLSAYSLNLTDSKGNTNYTIAEVTQNMSEEPLTRANETPNKGVFDLRIAVADGIAYSDLPESNNIVYALTTKDAFGNEIISEYAVKIKALTGASACFVDRVEAVYRTEHSLDELVGDRMNSAVDFYYTIEGADRNTAELLGVKFDADARTIYAEKEGIMPVTIHYLKTDGTTSTTIMNIKFTNIVVDVTVADMEWTITPDVKKQWTSSDVTAMKDLFRQGRYNIQLKEIAYTDGKIRVNGKDWEYNWTDQSIQFELQAADIDGEPIQINTVDDYAKGITFSVVAHFIPTKVAATSHDVTLNIVDTKDNNKVVYSTKFKVVVKQDNDAIFKFEPLSAYFDATKTEATAFGELNNIGDKILYNLNKLFSISTTDAQYITFEETAPTFNGVKAPAWLTGTTDEISVSPMKDIKEADGVADEDNAGAYSTRKFVSTYHPFNNERLATYSYTYNLTIKSPIKEGKQTGITNKSLSLDKRNFKFAMKDIKWQDINMSGNTYINWTNETRVSKYTVALSEIAAGYMTIQVGANIHEGTEPVEIKPNDEVVIALKTSVTDIINDVAATDSYVTLSVLDKWGATSQCKVDAPLKKRQ